MSPTWYKKSTEMGLLMNYHTLAPMKYKKSVIIGMIRRIFRAYNTYKHFQESLQKVRGILSKNQYPESVIDQLIRDTLNKIFEEKETVTESEEEDEEEEKKMLMVEYIVEKSLASLKIHWINWTPHVELFSPWKNWNLFNRP